MFQPYPTYANTDEQGRNPSKNHLVTAIPDPPFISSIVSELERAYLYYRIMKPRAQYWISHGYSDDKSHIKHYQNFEYTTWNHVLQAFIAARQIAGVATGLDLSLLA